MARKTSLSSELSNLINPEPTFEDPEDEGNVDTSNKWFNNVTDKANETVEASPFSKIRKKQISVLSSSNKRYIGKKINRSDLESEEDEDDGSEENASLNEIESDEEHSENGQEEEESEIGSSDDDSEIENSTRAIYPNSENGDDIQIVNIDSDRQIAKAHAVKNQLVIYDNLLETRIKLQKLLLSANRLLQGTEYFRARNSNSTLLTELFEDCSKGLRKLGKHLLEIDNFVKIDEKECSQQGKRKCTNFDEVSLSKRFCQLSTSYRPIIDNWHERTKFANANVKLKKFDSFKICPTKSIDQILTDKERLIRRTRIMRSQYRIVGQAQIEGEENNYSEQIYDDDDFYHQLLRQIIENKMGDLDDSTAMTKKYVEIQRMRNKLKKQVDTRASKGRKIRYDVHEKLVNFMAPIDNTTISEEAKNELFKSLFGNFNSNML